MYFVRTQLATDHASRAEQTYPGSGSDYFLPVGTTQCKIDAATATRGSRWKTFKSGTAYKMVPALKVRSIFDNFGGDSGHAAP